MITLPSREDVGNKSYAEILAELPEDQLAEVASQLTVDEQLYLAHSWDVHGRPTQQPPYTCEDQACGCLGDWTLWLILSGRSWGKSRTGSEWVHEVAWNYPGCRIGVIAPTAGDARRVMIEGESGILATAKPWNPCRYWPARLEITFANGTKCGVFSADEAERLRGPQHHFVWADELAAWKKAEDVWFMMKLGLRLPKKPGWPKYSPRVVVTTTPKPTDIVRRLAGARPFKKDRRTHVTLGSTYENRPNLAPEYFESVIKDLEGTRLGRQELLGVILDDVPGALWKSEMIEPYRIVAEQLPTNMKRIVVAVDPAAGGDNATGIVVCASGPVPGSGETEVVEDHVATAAALRKNQRLHGYVIADHSVKGSPDQWARAAVRAYHDYGANHIVAESNQGGEMVRYTINTVDASVPVKLVHATRNKQTRAEPIVALFEQGRIHLVDKLPKLEDELLTWDPEISPKSPDRLDAMVWGLTDLLGRGRLQSLGAPQIIGKRVNPWAIMPGAYTNRAA